MFVIKNLIYDYMGLKDYGELLRQEEEFKRLNLKRLRIPVIPDGMTAYAMLSLTFLVPSLIFWGFLEFPRNCHLWMCRCVSRLISILHYFPVSRVEFGLVPHKLADFRLQDLSLIPLAAEFELVLYIQGQISFLLFCLFFC